MASDLLRFPRGLDKLYDILDGSWMSAVTGGLYKVLSDLKPSAMQSFQAEEFCHNWEAGVRNAVTSESLLVLQVLVSLLDNRRTSQRAHLRQETDGNSFAVSSIGPSLKLRTQGKPIRQLQLADFPNVLFDICHGTQSLKYGNQINPSKLATSLNNQNEFMID